MKLFSVFKANFAALQILTTPNSSHLIRRNTKSKSSADRIAERDQGSGEKKELYMKATKLFTLLAGSSLLLSASAFAGNGGKKSLHFDTAVTIEGKQLAPGDYKFSWTGTGNDVKLDIVKGKETVATVPAHIVTVPRANREDGYSSTAAEDGSHAVTAVFFTGDKFDLEIGQGTSASTAPAAATTSPN
jgi:hypothetical protein